MQLLYRLQCEHGVLKMCYPGYELEVYTGAVNVTDSWKSTPRVRLCEATKRMNPFNSKLCVAAKVTTPGRIVPANWPISLAPPTVTQDDCV